MRAILVEDSSTAADVTRRVLQHLGYVVTDEDLLESGSHVLYRLSKEPPPELLVIDICLPGEWDGVDILRAVRNVGVRGQTPAIVLTSGMTPSEGTMRVIREHNGVFLAKPHKVAALRDAIAEAEAASTDWSIKTLDEDLPAVSGP
jgi:CheY-like chemotaxis protein